MIRIFIFSFFFIWFLSCSKVVSSTPEKFSRVKNNVKVNQGAPVVVYGDTRNNYKIHRKIVKSFMDKKPAMVFNTGDLVYDGNNTELWPIFLDIIKPILKTARYYPVLGNHERESDNYFKIFNLPHNKKWYRIDFKNMAFFVLDSNSDLGLNSRQYLWLEKELKSCDSDFRILVFHQPVFSVGRHGGSSFLQKSLTGLMEKYSVQLVFNGHDHAYQRFFKGNINYIVTGGGGAPLYDKEENSASEKYLKKYMKVYHYCLLFSENRELKVLVYDINNNIIDDFSIK